MSKYVYDSTLIGKHSKFDQEMCDKYDKPARDKLKEILKNFVMDNPNIYRQDLIINDESCKYKYLEIQVCTNWISDKFPYPNVYIYERKNKYDTGTLFITLNKFLNRCYIFDYESIKNVKPVRMKKYSREFIYNIPWHRVMYFEIDNLTPENIKLY